MAESAELIATLLGQMVKATRSLSEEEVKHLASGESKLAVVPQGHRVIETTRAVEAALKLLAQMSPADLRQVEDKTAKLVLLRKGDKVVSPFDPVQVAEQVSALKSEAEIVRLLDEDSRLTAPSLRKVAAELSVIVPPSVKTKEALQLHIAQSVVRDRDRWSWR